MAPHSSTLAWRIPGTGEPGGPLSVGSHRVGHDWSDLAGAAAACPALISHLLLAPWPHWLLSVSHTCHFFTHPRPCTSTANQEAGRFYALRLANSIPPLFPQLTLTPPWNPGPSSGTLPGAPPHPIMCSHSSHSFPPYNLSQLTVICVTADHGPPAPWTSEPWVLGWNSLWTLQSLHLVGIREFLNG